MLNDFPTDVLSSSSSLYRLDVELVTVYFPLLITLGK